MRERLAILCVVIVVVACTKRSPQNADQTVSMARGQVLYETHCAPCHGESGKGNGPLAEMQWPRPRDFTAGIFKYRATRGPIPSDTDLLQTMKVGIPGSPMPGWDLLSLNDWKSILSHVKTLIPQLAGQKQGPRFEVPEGLKTTPASIQQGRELFTGRGCVSCHGIQGAGDGAAAASLRDSWGNIITPRDLAHGLLKWGNTPKDIYRTLALGVPGTPMPAFEHTFTREQLWALVHYIKSIQKPLPKDYDPSNPRRNLIGVAATKTLPTDPGDPAWNNVPAVPVFLKPLWAQPGITEWIAVRALHDDRSVSFLLSWVDGRRDASGNKDGVALEFPADQVPTAADVPFVGMGSPKKPVSIWFWKDGVGIAGFMATGIHHMTPVRPLPAGLSGKGVYDHGEWQVIMSLPIATMGKGAEPGEGARMGFISIALWDGSTKSRPGPETFSEWMIYELR